MAVLLALLLFAGGAAQDSSAGGGLATPSLSVAGTTWHSVHIDGDALFFVVREIGIRFEDQTRFAAAVRLIDGGQSSRRGTYRIVAPGTMLLTIDGAQKPKEVGFSRDGNDLIVHDRAYDVRARLAPGGMQDERWF
jgi:hypothetical protein